MNKQDLEKIYKQRRLSGFDVVKVLHQDKVKVYVAGPIAFAEDMQEYRKVLKDTLEKLSPKFEIHDPWEREHGKPCQVKSAAARASEEDKIVAEEIITEDLKDIAICDIVIAYMFRIGSGTSMEIFWASRVLGKPVILIYQTEEGNSVPLWLYGHANLIFQSKQGMVRFLRRELEDGDEDDGHKEDR
jgi:nucleoside 2-deoxyribosyltransferase